MWIIRHTRIFISLAVIFVLAAVIILGIKGVRPSIEFTGGSAVEISYNENTPELAVVQETLDHFDFAASVQSLGDTHYLIRTRELSESDRAVLLESLTFENATPSLERLNTIGPTVGQELRSKAFLSMILVALGIIIFIAFAFRTVARPVASWKYGVIAVVALIHDVIIPLGIFALLGKEANTLLVVGLLSILGLSVNDTIVVFDRIRENLKINLEKEIVEPFKDVVGRAINQTMARSINTSMTLLVVLGVLWFVGPVATQDLALVLFLGTFFGTYSSIFVASPLLVLWNNWDQKKQ